MKSIGNRYMSAMTTFVQHRFPHEPERVASCLHQLRMCQNSADLLQCNKLLYVPFVLNADSCSRHAPPPPPLLPIS